MGRSWAEGAQAQSGISRSGLPRDESRKRWQSGGAVEGGDGGDGEMDSAGIADGSTGLRESSFVSSDREVGNGY